MTNDTRKGLLANTLLASAGLFLFGFGVYLTIQAGLGVAPWDAFNYGLSGTIGISYGDASVAVSLIILCIDLLLREKIGIGMFLDAFIVGKTVDLFNLIDLVPKENALPLQLLTISTGMVIMGFAQWMYMKAGLGCGPRDTLLVGLSRRLPRVPIGAISIVILTTVTAIGWALGGEIGIGTVICAALEGPIMQAEFRLAGFDATAQKHQNLLASAQVLAGRTLRKEA